jgi:hypothetical protein
MTAVSIEKWASDSKFGVLGGMKLMNFERMTIISGAESVLLVNMGAYLSIPLVFIKCHHA